MIMKKKLNQLFVTCYVCGEQINITKMIGPMYGPDHYNWRKRYDYRVKRHVWDKHKADFPEHIRGFNFTQFLKWFNSMDGHTWRMINEAEQLIKRH